MEVKSCFNFKLANVVVFVVNINRAGLIVMNGRQKRHACTKIGKLRIARILLAAVRYVTSGLGL